MNRKFLNHYQHLIPIQILTILAVNSVKALLSSEVKWTHELVLETGFEIKWDSEDPDFLTMEMSASTTGYLGVGFSPKGDMLDSDIVIAWVDSMGIPHLKDFHGVGKADPIEDIQQDYFLIAASERENKTTVRFHRRWETCDEQHDIKIGNDTMRLIWAWHPEDPKYDPMLKFPWHGITSRGMRNVFMRLPNRPLPFPDGEDGLREPSSDVKFWDLTLEDVDIEGTKDHILMCKLFTLPRHKNPKPYQMIGFRPLITEENEQHIHRITVRQCHIPKELVTSRKSLEEYFDGKTKECQSPELPLSSSSQWTKSCTDVLLQWAFGSEGEMFPSHVGIPFGGDLLSAVDLGTGNSITSYFKLEVHYADLFGKQFLDSSGIRVFYTNQARLYDGGSLQVGHRVSPFLAIPPAQEGFRIYSICSIDCTRNSVPEAGLNVVNAMFHSHEFGRKMKLRHVRNGKELSPIAEDNNYTNKYQQYRIMKNEVKIFPGDELILECEYNTLHRTAFTFGGYSAEEEMCQALLFYYPRANLSACGSKPEFQSFFSGFGIKSLMGEGLRRIEYNQPLEGDDLVPPIFQLEVSSSDDKKNPFDSVFTAFPLKLPNITVGEHMRSVDWREKHVSKNLENSWKNGKYFAYCEGREGRIPYRKYVDEIPKFTKYRKISNSICRKQKLKSSAQKNSAKLVIFVIVIFNALYIYNYIFLNASSVKMSF